MMMKVAKVKTFRLPAGRLAAALGILVVLMMAGCGQKGPLYVPDTPVQQDKQDEDS
jgi:predicted small lipoprotein YifL